MDTVSSNGQVTEAYLTKKEYEAYEIISLFKNLNYSTKDLKKAFEDAKINTKDQLTGAKAFNMSKRGVEIYQGKMQGSFSNHQFQDWEGGIRNY